MTVLRQGSEGERSPFGIRLREWRRRRALSQTELGRLAKVQPATVARLELGQQSPRPSTIRKLAIALAIEPPDLDP